MTGRGRSAPGCALPTRVPGAELPVDDAVEPHTPPAHGDVRRVLACLRAATACWRCGDTEAAPAPCGEVNGDAGTVPLCLCARCLHRRTDTATTCWRCADTGTGTNTGTGFGTALTACGEVTDAGGTEPLYLCPGCLRAVTRAYDHATRTGR